MPIQLDAFGKSLLKKPSEIKLDDFGKNILDSTPDPVATTNPQDSLDLGQKILTNPVVNAVLDPISQVVKPAPSPVVEPPMMGAIPPSRERSPIVSVIQGLLGGSVIDKFKTTQDTMKGLEQEPGNVPVTKGDFRNLVDRQQMREGAPANVSVGEAIDPLSPVFLKGMMGMKPIELAGMTAALEAKHKAISEPIRQNIPEGLGRDAFDVLDFATDLPVAAVGARPMEALAAHRVAKQGQVHAEIAKDLPKIREELKKTNPQMTDEVLNQLTPQHITEAAKTDPMAAEYVNKVQARVSPFSKLGLSTQDVSVPNKLPEVKDNIKGSQEAAPQKGVAEVKPDAPVFFSKLEQVVKDKIPNNASPEQIMNTLIAAGVKQDEIDWTDTKGFLEGKTKVSKQELIDHVNQNKVEIKDIEYSNEKGMSDTKREQLAADAGQARVERDDIARKLGSLPYITGIPSRWVYRLDDTKDGPGKIQDVPAEYVDKLDEIGEREQAYNRYLENLDDSNPDGTETKFQSYQLSGGKNYRELLLTLPPNKDIRTTVPIEKWYTNLQSWDKGLFGNKKFEDLTSQELETLKEVYDSQDRSFVSKKGSELDFNSSHFPEPNILSHVRMNDRTDANGKKVLFIEEVQSDWHQKGRKQGYAEKAPEDIDAQMKSVEKQMADLVMKHPNMPGGGRTPEIQDQINAYGDELNRLTDLKSERNFVPNAPFKKTWHELAMKKMLRYAAENGYDKLAWTTGEQQAERYDLSKQINDISWKADKREYSDGIKLVRLAPKNGALIRFSVDKDGLIGRDTTSSFAPPDMFIGKQLDEAIGKELADKILKDQEGELSDAGLKMGGEGMKGFYDQIIPAFMNKYAKKWGGRVAESMVPTTEKTGERLENVGNIERRITKRVYAKVHSIDITPSMKQSVMKEGQPLFDKQGDMIAPGEPEIGPEIPAENLGKEEIKGRKTVGKYADLEDAIVNVEFLKTAKGENALGLYYKLKLRLPKGADIRTYVHEMGHAIFDMFLTRLEKRQLLDAVIKQRNITAERNPKESDVDHNAKIDAIAEEYLMRDFTKYAGLGWDASSKSTLFTKLKSLFDRLLYRIQKFFKVKSDIIKDFYDDILNKKYKGAKVKEGVGEVVPKYEKYSESDWEAVDLKNSLEKMGKAEIDPVYRENKTAKELVSELADLVSTFEASKVHKAKQGEAAFETIKTKSSWLPEFSEKGYTQKYLQKVYNKFDQGLKLTPKEAKDLIYTVDAFSNMMGYEAPNLQIDIKKIRNDKEALANIRTKENKAKFREIRDKLAKPFPVKKSIAENVGLKKEAGKTITATEEELYKRELQQGEKASKAGQKQGEKQGAKLERVKQLYVSNDKITALKRKAELQRLKDNILARDAETARRARIVSEYDAEIAAINRKYELNKLKADIQRRYEIKDIKEMAAEKDADIKNVKKFLVDYVNENLPPELRYKLITQIRDVNPKNIGDAILKVEKIKDDLDAKEKAEEAKKRFTPDQRKNLFLTALDKGLIIKAEGGMRNRLDTILNNYPTASFSEVKGYLDAITGSSTNKPFFLRLSDDINKDAAAMRLVDKMSNNWKDINKTEIGTLDLVRVVEKVTGLDGWDDQNILMQNTSDVLSSAMMDKFNAYEEAMADLHKNVKGLRADTKQSAEAMRKAEAGEVLTFEERAAVEYVRGQFEKWFRIWNEARAILKKKPVAYRQNYLTHIRERNSLMKMFSGNVREIDSLTNDQLDAIRKSDFTKPNSKKSGHEKKREGETTKYDLVGNYVKYLDSIMDEIYLAKAVSHSRKFIEYSLLKFPNAYKQMSMTLDVLAGKPSVYDSIPILGPMLNNTLVKKLRSAIAGNALIGNINFIATNASNLATSAGELGIYTIKGAAGFLGNKTLREKAFKMSRILQQRKNQFDADVKAVSFVSPDTIKGMSAADAGKVAVKQMRAAVESITRFVEYFNVGSTWVGGYMKAIQVLKLSPEKAAKYADRITKRAQVGYSVLDLPTILQSNVGKTVLMFQSWPFNSMNYMLYDIGLAKGANYFKNLFNDKKENVDIRYADFLKLIATLTVIASIYEYFKLNNPYKVSGVGPRLPGKWTDVPVGRTTRDLVVGSRLDTLWGQKHTEKAQNKALASGLAMVNPLKFGGSQISRAINGEVIPGKEWKQKDAKAKAVDIYEKAMRTENKKERESLWDKADQIAVEAGVLKDEAEGTAEKRIRKDIIELYEKAILKNDDMKLIEKADALGKVAKFDEDELDDMFETAQKRIDRSGDKADDIEEQSRTYKPRPGILEEAKKYIESLKK